MSREELRVLMLPWVGVLRDYVDVGEWHATWDAHGDRVVWVQMVSNGPRGIEPRAFDAMELLTLLGEIDYVAWRMALAVAWPRQASTWIEAANGHALRFGWKLVFRSARANDDPSAMDIAKWCDRIAVDGAARSRPREYLRARTVLENQYKQLETTSERAMHRPVPRERLQIPVHLAVKEGPLETRLLKLLQLAALQHARDASPVSLFRANPWKPLMRITEVDADGLAQDLSPKAFLNAAQLAAFNIRLSTLSLDGLDVSMDTAMLYTTGLQCLLATKQVNTGGKLTIGGPLDSVVIPAAMERQTIDAVFSAITVSSSVRNVSVNSQPASLEARVEAMAKMSAGTREHMWRWIAVSLFSSYASNRVTHVDIDVQDLCQQDVAVMERALGLECALHAVGADPNPTGSEPAEGGEYATASQFRLLPPGINVHEGIQTTLSFGMEKVPVLSKRPDGWLAVMLAGWGTAWLHRDDIEGEINQRVVDKSAAGSPHSLRLSAVTRSSSAAVVSLLRLIGRNVTTLELAAIKIDERLDDWLRGILRVCPCLEELKIAGGYLTTLDTFTEGFEQGYSHLQRLTLCQTSIADAAHVSRFFHTLADPTHLMAQQLRVFSLSCRSNDPLPGVAEAVHVMLQANATLESLSMNVRFMSHVPAEQLIRRREFAAYETPIAVRLLPLTLRKKMAFLSVTGSRHSEGTNGSESSAVHQFDSRIVSLIFQFAAQCRKRSVSVQFWK